MTKYNNLTIIGSSHISKESVKKVKSEIASLKPDIIALELDSARLKAMMSNSRASFSTMFKKLGFKGLIFNLIGSYVEKKLGKYTGIKPGSEMKTAISLAKKNKIKLALIDQPIEITIKKLTTQITKKEKLQFLKDIFLSPFTYKKRIKFDIRKVPSKKVINQLIKEVKTKYPTAYRILIKERNEYMAKALSKLISTYKQEKILAIMGAGHEDEVIKLIKNG